MIVIFSDFDEHEVNTSKQNLFEKIHAVLDI